MKNKNEHGGLVYSTGGVQPQPQLDDASPTLPPRQQDLRITLDKKLKGGKQATVVYNFAGTDADLEALGKILKTHCGVGGSVKNGEIILQGNCLDKVQAKLRALDYRFKLAGV
jgi:translation initiation factor 1